MRRFLLFSGEDYYPAGGWNDFDGDYATQTEAVAAIPDPSTTHDGGISGFWWHVIDTDTMEEIDSDSMRRAAEPGRLQEITDWMMRPMRPLPMGVFRPHVGPLEYSPESPLPPIPG